MPGAVEELLLHGWPDNLRGIDRLVHRLAVEADGSPISRAQVCALLRTPARTEEVTADEPAVLRRAAPTTAEELVQVLDRFGGSVRSAARWYGRHRRQVYRWMEALGVERAEQT